MFKASTSAQWSILFIAAILPIAGCNRQGRPQNRPVVYTLVYEIDADDPMAAKVSETEAFREPAQRRLDSEHGMLGEIRTTKDNCLHVGLYDKSAETLQSVKDRFRSQGNLEFRIVANFKDHSDVIERAKTTDGQIVYDDRPDHQDKPRAKWVKIIAAQEQFFSFPERYAVRTTPDDQTEILVMLDPFNITSTHMKQVAPGIDFSELPCVNFALNPVGAELFGHMTSDNLPDPDGQRRQLAIILDDYLYTAPMIQSAIYANGQITGNFTFAESIDLATILGSGPFPSRLRLVREGSVGSESSGDK